VFAVEKIEVKRHCRLGMFEMAFWVRQRTRERGPGHDEQQKRVAVKAKGVLLGCGPDKNLPWSRLLVL
jgi:hypothetical protein